MPAGQKNNNAPNTKHILPSCYCLQLSSYCTASQHVPLLTPHTSAAPSASLRALTSQGRDAGGPLLARTSRPTPLRLVAGRVCRVRLRACGRVWGWRRRRGRDREEGAGGDGGGGQGGQQDPVGGGGEWGVGIFCRVGGWVVSVFVFFPEVAVR